VSPSEKSETSQTELKPSAHPRGGWLLGLPHVVTCPYSPSLSLLHPLLMPPCPVRLAVPCSSSTDALMRALVRRSLDTRSSGDIPSGQQAAHGVGWGGRGCWLLASFFFVEISTRDPNSNYFRADSPPFFLQFGRHSIPVDVRQHDPFRFCSRDPIRSDKTRLASPRRPFTERHDNNNKQASSPTNEGPSRADVPPERYGRQKAAAESERGQRVSYTHDAASAAELTAGARRQMTTRPGPVPLLESHEFS
jgi:hypothetical protein